MATKMTFTNIPEEMQGVKLYAWSTGLRMEGCVPNARRIKGRVHFDPRGLVKLAMYQPRTLREAKKITGEVWKVLVRRGRFWRLSHYLLPGPALRMARAAVEDKYGEAEAVKMVGRPVMEMGVMVDCAVPF